MLSTWSERLNCSAITEPSNSGCTALKKNKVQSVPYLNTAHWHEGQTDTERKHPCFLHLELQLLPLPPFFMAVPTFTSLLLYLSALHNTDTDKEREEEKGNSTELQSSITAKKQVKWMKLICKLELPHGKKAHTTICQKCMVSFLKLGLHLVFVFFNRIPSCSALEITASRWITLEENVPHCKVAPYHVTTFYPRLNRLLRIVITGLGVPHAPLFFTCNVYRLQRLWPVCVYGVLSW